MSGSLVLGSCRLLEQVVKIIRDGAGGKPMKTTMESDCEALLSKRRIAPKRGVSGIGARQIADMKRKLEMLRRRCESVRAVASILLAQQCRSRQARQRQECSGATNGASDRREHQSKLIEGAHRLQRTPFARVGDPKNWGAVKRKVSSLARRHF